MFSNFPNYSTATLYAFSLAPWAFTHLPRPNANIYLLQEAFLVPQEELFILPLGSTVVLSCVIAMISL